MYPDTLRKSASRLLGENKRGVRKTRSEESLFKTNNSRVESESINHKLVPSFKGLNEHEITIVNRGLVKKQYDAKEYLYLPGEGNNRIYFLAAGNVEMGIMDRNGRELIVDVLGAGDILGAPMGAGIHNSYARTLNDVVIFTMDKVEFDEILQQYPKVAYKLLKLLMFKMNVMQKKIESLVFRDVRSRICYQLFRLYQKSGDIKTGNIGIQLTHQDLANMVGSSRETTSLYLSQLRRDGIIAYDRKEFRILSVRELRRQMN